MDEKLLRSIIREEVELTLEGEHRSVLSDIVSFRRAVVRAFKDAGMPSHIVRNARESSEKYTGIRPIFHAFKYISAELGQSGTTDNSEIIDTMRHHVVDMVNDILLFDNHELSSTERNRLANRVAEFMILEI